MQLHIKIVEYGKKERVITTSEIADKFNLSWNTAENYLLNLQIQGKVEKVKKKGVNIWLAK